MSTEMTSASLTDLLSSAQLAEHLGVKERTVRAWRARGEGPVPVQNGPKWVRYRRCDVDTWLEQLRTSPTPAAPGLSATSPPLRR